MTRKFLLSMVLIVNLGCSSSPEVRHFGIHQATSGTSTYSRNDLAIAIGRIVVPEYVRQDVIVTQRSGSEYDLRSSNRWIEPLEASVSKGLREALLAYSSDFFVTSSVSRIRPDYILEVEVLQLDIDLRKGNAQLSVQWVLATNDNLEPFLFERLDYFESRQTESISIEQAPQLVSDVVSKFGVTVARSITALVEIGGQN